MSYKIAFSDIDGTLLNADREPSPALKKEVKRLAASNIPFILISSRMPQAMTWIQDDLGITGLPLVCYNGGLVIVDGEVVHSQEIPIIFLATIRKINEKLGLSVQLFHGEEWYVEEMDHYARREENNTRVKPQMRGNRETALDWADRPVSAHKIMVMGDPAGIDEMVARLEKITDGDYLHLYRSKDDYLEIASKEISKLTGISKVLEHKYPDLTLADCVAFGDNYNDIEMLEGVGLGVAVANARAEVLEVANITAGAAKEDGVALALKEFMK
ncbi:HAD family phosphatase [Neolewinella aurantiaca]|uniref:HAD family phosphatase n=1 Tax=Neolewinella aurantiaca TaxID=2602767 RepID=A0A5C7FFM1_9BACT|nr:Cof-type HAD-IIB family hydrolase [Neolewinella aurantiaca]TXF89653.1 HAD family phosphatase [Neolewinella aurantiaca]